MTRTREEYCTIRSSACFVDREEVLTVVALLSTDNLLYNSPEKVISDFKFYRYVFNQFRVYKISGYDYGKRGLQREEAVEVRRKFTSPDGDHMTYLNMYRSYRGVKGDKVSIASN